MPGPELEMAGRPRWRKRGRGQWGGEDRAGGLSARGRYPLPQLPRPNRALPVSAVLDLV